MPVNGLICKLQKHQGLLCKTASHLPFFFLPPARRRGRHGRRRAPPPHRASPLRSTAVGSSAATLSPSSPQIGRRDAAHAVIAAAAPAAVRRGRSGDPKWAAPPPTSTPRPGASDAPTRASQNAVAPRRRARRRRGRANLLWATVTSGPRIKFFFQFFPNIRCKFNKFKFKYTH